jgi:hypothetical protein
MFYRIVTYAAKFKQLLQKLGSNGAERLWMSYRDVLWLLLSILYKELSDAVNKECVNWLALGNDPETV